jgi:Tol biopolymer transport system component
MDRSRWQQLDMLLKSALERPVAERGAFLDAACSGNATMRREVESLLRHDEGEGLLEDSADEELMRLLADDGSGALVGREVGHYAILERLGRGGMGVVYRAHDTRLGRTVALKLLPPRFTRDRERLRRFEREARAASFLNHPNILTIYDIGTDGPTPFIATEFIDGETLRERMARAPLPLAEAVRVAAQVADALVAAHEAGIVHRDVKPENIMIRRRDGYVKVLDFGLAKLTERPESAAVDTAAQAETLLRTGRGVVMGTPAYMSPEQARGQSVDTRSDVWSFGVVLYEMLTGLRPFEGETAEDMRANVLKEQPRPLPETTPAPLREIVEKSLRKEPAARFQTFGELLAALRALQPSAGEFTPHAHAVQGVGTDAAATRETGGEARGETAPARSQTHVSSAEFIVSQIRRNKTAAVVIVAALVVAAGGTPLLVRRLNSHPAEPFAKMSVGKLTNTGRVSQAAVSPDGKYAATVVGGAGQQSLWLRHITTGSDKEIVPTLNGGDFAGVNFSPDGDYIYYSRWESAANVLHRVPVLGGADVTLLREVDGPLSFSPDGRQLTFVRGDPPRGLDIIVVANSDGTGERELVQHKSLDLYPGKVSGPQAPAWSPDGSLIAYGLRSNVEGQSVWDVQTARVSDGAETVVTSQHWKYFSGLAWMPDGAGLVIAAAEAYSGTRQLWHISYPSGEARRITNDSNNYRAPSLTRDGTSILTVQTDQPTYVWVAPGGDAARAEQVTTQKSDGELGLSWMPSGHVVYTSTASGNRDLWSLDPATGEKRQLTNTPPPEFRPWATPDDRYIVYAAGGGGITHIWRMDADGGNPRQLTNGANEQSPSCTPDGAWVVYTESEGGIQSIWKVPIDGGASVRLTEPSTSSGVVSPDGRLLACDYILKGAEAPKWVVATLPIEGGTPKELFTPLFLQRVHWAPDGRAILYVETKAGVSNIWSHPLDGTPPKRLTDFKSEEIFDFDWSRNGNLVCSRGLVLSDAVLIKHVN